MNYVKCGQCRVDFEHGARICHGCHGRVIYGASGDERTQGMQLGGILFGVIAGLLLYAVPGWLNSSFQWNIPSAWGLSNGAGLIALGVSVVVGALVGIWATEKMHEGEIRTVK